MHFRKNHGKRLMCFLTVLAFFFVNSFCSPLTFVAAAEPIPDMYACEIVGGARYESLTDALTAVTSGQTIRMLKNYSHTGGITFASKSVTLDLNGFSLSVSNTSGPGLQVANGHDINITGPVTAPGTLTLTGRTYGIYASGIGSSITITNAAVTANATLDGPSYWDQFNGCGVSAIDGASVILAGTGTLDATGVFYGAHAYGSGSSIMVTNATASGGYAGYGASAENSGLVSVTANATANAPYGVGGHANNLGILNIAGNAQGGDIGIYALGASTVHVTGNAIGLPSGGMSRGVDGASGAQITIGGNSEGKWRGVYATDNDYATSPPTSVTIGGNAVCTGVDNDANSYNYYGANATARARITINGVIVTTDGYIVCGAEPKTISDVTDPSTVSGYRMYTNGSGYVFVKDGTTAVCQIVGGASYESLADALSAVQNNQTIRMLRNWTHTGGITFDGSNASNVSNVTFDLNGYTLSVNNGAAQGIGLWVKYGAAVTITGGGTFNINGAMYGICVMGIDTPNVLPGTLVTINNTTVNATGDSGMVVEGTGIANVSITGSGALNASGTQYGVYAHLPGSVATVTSASANGLSGYAAFAEGATINVTGNATATGSSSIGGYAGSKGTLNIGGNAQGGARGIYSHEASTIHVTGNAIGTGSGSQGLYVIDGSQITIGGNSQGASFGAIAMGTDTSTETPTRVTIGGNAVSTSAYDNVAHKYGAWVSLGAKITIDGKIVTADGYILCAAQPKTITDVTLPSTQTGYDTYTDNISTVWVKSSIKPVPVPVYTATYAINASATKGGTISPVGGIILEEFSIQAYTIVPDKGYKIEDVLVDGKSVGAVERYTFYSVVADHSIEAKFVHDCPGKLFKDVDTTKWYHKAVDFILRAGLFKGTSSTTFEPNAAMTRAMIVTVLHRLEGSPASGARNPFYDVKAGQWHTGPVVWAASNNIVKGIGDGKFSPADGITREQLVTILYRYAVYKGYDVSVGQDTNILSYTDAFDVSEYAIPAVQWACGSGIFRGKTKSTLDPLDVATRAETSEILMLFMEKYGKQP